MKVATMIKIASTKKEIQEFQRLVFDKYCLTMGWHNPDDYPNQMLLDSYDQFSVFIVVYKDNRIVGGTRLVRESINGFPHEKQVGITLPYLNSTIDSCIKNKLSILKREQIMEVTKTISTSVKNMISKDLAKALYWYGYYEDIQAFFMVIDMPFFLQCHRIDVPLHPIATPGFIEGSWTIPAILFTDEIKTQTKKENPLLWDYIKDHSNLLGDWRLSEKNIAISA